MFLLPLIYVSFRMLSNLKLKFYAVMRLLQDAHLKQRVAETKNCDIFTDCSRANQRRSYLFEEAP